MTKNLLIIFAKNPVLGQCKTRLAKGIGAKNALAVYRILLQHTAQTTRNLKIDKEVFYTDFIDHEDLWDPGIFKKSKQVNGSLGEKMQAAFEAGFKKGYQKIVLIGTDLISLEASDIQGAFKALESDPVVFGPAQDGGYYLIGLTRTRPELFKNIPWSTAEVLTKSLEQLDNVYQLLQIKNDIDTVEDLAEIPVFLPFIPLL
jgi:rSAM/selenodomain-associated transferase 1